MLLNKNFSYYLPFIFEIDFFLFLFVLLLIIFLIIIILTKSVVFELFYFFWSNLFLNQTYNIIYLFLTNYLTLLAFISLMSWIYFILGKFVSFSFVDHFGVTVDDFLFEIIIRREIQLLFFKLLRITICLSFVTI